MRKKVLATVLGCSAVMTPTLLAQSAYAQPQSHQQQHNTLGDDYNPHRTEKTFKFSPLDDGVMQDIFKNRQGEDSTPVTSSDSKKPSTTTTKKTVTRSTKSTVTRKTVTVTVTPTETQTATETEDALPPDWEGYVPPEDTGQEGVDSQQPSVDLSSLDLGDASARAKKAVKYAYEQLGTPYVWGGTTMSSPGAANGGLDCSGLTQGVYAKAGVSISRTTYTQVNEGRAVSINQIKPGDLVFYNGTEHVAIYVGNGQVIHAPMPGQTVTKAPVSMMSIENIRRVA